MSFDRCETAVFTPHWTDSLRVIHLLPAVFLPVYLLTHGGEDGFGTRASVAALMALAAASASVILAEIRRRRTCLSVGGGMITFRRGGVRKTMRAESCVCIEKCREPLCGFFGGTRVRLYADCQRRPWISLALPEERAETLAGYMTRRGVERDECRPAESISSGRHAPAATVTSDGTVIPVFAAAQLAILARGSVIMNLLAGALILAAGVNALVTFISFRGLSLTRRGDVWEVTSGFSGGKKTLIPVSAADGIYVRAGFGGLLAGWGRAEIIFSGGRTVPCVCCLPLGEIRSTALRLMDADGRRVTGISDTASLCRRYARRLTAAAFALTPLWYFGWRSAGEDLRLLAAIAGTGVSLYAVRCLAGLYRAGSEELELTPSAICVGGMGLLGAEHIFIKRGRVAGVRLKSGIPERMHGLCSAEVFTAGRSPCVWCSCIPQGKADGLIARFG